MFVVCGLLPAVCCSLLSLCGGGCVAFCVLLFVVRCGSLCAVRCVLLFGCCCVLYGFKVFAVVCLLICAIVWC